MPALSIQIPYPIFSDRDGQPLENGYVWIGQPYLDPQTNPVQVYLDDALTIPVAQPLRTIGGYVSNSGTPAQLYINGVNFSIRVLDNKGTLVYYFPDGSGINPDAAGVTYNPGPDSLLLPGGPISVKAALDEITDDETGSSVVGFLQAGTGAVPTTVQAKLREFAVSVKDFGAVGDGIANDRNAINDAFAAVIARGYGTVFFPFGTYYISDLIGNTNFAGNTQPISIGVDADFGTVISCNPSVFANTALFLRFIDLQYAIVKNLTVDCNNKTSAGIFVTGNNATKAVLINNCQVRNCFGIDNVGATTSVFGIYASSALGDFCSITNCRVSNVRRAKQTLACQAIVAQGCINTNVTDNIVFNVRHDGTALQDADGIAVFSYLDGSNRYYRPSVATIANNRIIDCEGRFIKLQTHGSALVQGNVMAIENAIELVNEFQYIDSQVGQATIVNNKFEAGASWTGGASSRVAILQTPRTINPLLQNNEVFTQKFNDNEVYTLKPFPIGIILEPFRANVASKNVIDVRNNKFFRDAQLSSSSEAVTTFINFNTIPNVIDVTGQSIWTICGNQIASDNFIGIGSGLTRVDYTDKWWMYIYDNVNYGTGSNLLIRNLGVNVYDFPYTSNVMIRDNQIRTNPTLTSDLFGAPIDTTKLINGSDFTTGDSSAGTISPAPANWRNGHFGRKGGVLFAETEAGGAAYRYISRDNGANWYQV